MYIRLSCIPIGIFFLLDSISAKKIESITTEDADESERLILGKSATPGQFPFACALHYNNQFICTCSILSPTVVLTAAHCVDFNGVVQPHELFYAIANLNRSAPSYRIEFQNVTRHPEYNANDINNDVAIFKTLDVIPFSDEVGGVCIAAPNTPPMKYSSAIAMGWGKTTDYETFLRRIFGIQFPAPPPPETLQYAKQKVVSESKCSKVNSGVDENKICATRGLMGICNGDSGGPLVSEYAEGQYVQIGIASYINGMVGCGKTVPGVWTRVSSYYDYIMQNAEGAEICTV